MNNPDSWGVGPIPMNNPDGIRMSTSLTYLNPVRHRLNLTVRSGVTAHRLIFDGSRVVGVDVESGGERFIVEGDEFICCGGAVGSPQLLLLSGVGPAEHLGEMGIQVHHELPGVGRNLRDHPNVRIPVRVKEGFPLDPEAPAPSLPCATPPRVPTTATICRFCSLPSLPPWAATPWRARASGSPASLSWPWAPAS